MRPASCRWWPTWSRLPSSKLWPGAPSGSLPCFFFNDTATTEIYTLSLHDALPIYDPVRCPDRLVAERLEAHPRTRAQGLRPAVHQHRQASVLQLRDERDGLAPAGLAQLTDLAGHQLQRLVPAHGAERATLALLGPGEAIGMIGALEGGLAPEAERAAVDGMVGIALELDDAPLAVARDDAATGRALAAHGREPRG